MIRVIQIATIIALTNSGAVFAQNFATYEQPSGVSSSESTSQGAGVSGLPDIQPEGVGQIESVESVPAYSAYDQTNFDASGYESVTDTGTVYESPQSTAPPPVPVALETIPFQPATPEPPAPVELGTTQETDLSQPLGAPETFAVIDPNAPQAELGFHSETETSRLLLALQDTYEKRVSELKAQHLEQRSALLDELEKEAADPSKVIGLAERMRNALAELEATQKAMLQVEERQYTEATLKVLDAAPSRTQ